MNGLQFLCIESAILNHCSEKECDKLVEYISERRLILRNLEYLRIWKLEIEKLLSISNKYERELNTFIPISQNSVNCIVEDTLYYIENGHQCVFIYQKGGSVKTLYRGQNNQNISKRLQKLIKFIWENKSKDFKFF